MSLDWKANLTVLMFLPLVLLLMGADDCRSAKEVAHEKAEAVGLKDYHCLNFTGYKSADLSFCTAGRTLVICDDTGVNSCLTVNLDAELPRP